MAFALDFLRTLRDKGFEVVLELPAYDNEWFYVLFNKTDGILLHFDIFRGVVNSGYFQFNWKPNHSKQEPWNSSNISGHIIGDSGVYDLDIYCNYPTSLSTIEWLRERGKFITPWQSAERLCLLHYGDTHKKDDEKVKIHNERIAMLPQYVRMAMGATSS